MSNVTNLQRRRDGSIQPWLQSRRSGLAPCQREHLHQAWNELSRVHIQAVKVSGVQEGLEIDVRTIGISFPLGSFVLGMFVPAVSETHSEADGDIKGRSMRKKVWSRADQSQGGAVGSERSWRDYAEQGSHGKWKERNETWEDPVLFSI